MKKIAFLCCLFALSAGVNAGIIQYGDYSYDTDGDVVTGQSLEWLRWDVTQGQSINQALAAYSAEGWRLAETAEMSALLNGFFDLGAGFDTDESTYQDFALPYGPDESLTSASYAFLAMFGATVFETSPLEAENAAVATLSLYGSDLDGDNLFEVAGVVDDFWYSSGPQDGSVFQTEDAWLASSPDSIFGVALVRVAQVPEPAPLLLLVTSLLFMQWRRTTACQSPA